MGVRRTTSLRSARLKRTARWVLAWYSTTVQGLTGTRADSSSADMRAKSGRVGGERRDELISSLPLLLVSLELPGSPASPELLGV